MMNVISNLRISFALPFVLAFVVACPGCANQEIVPSSSVAETKVYTRLTQTTPDLGGRLLSIDWTSPVYTGYSASLFEGRKKSMEEATQLALAAGDKILLVEFANIEEIPFSMPPPGRVMGGVYFVTKLRPMRFVPATPENLLVEIRGYEFATAGTFAFEHAEMILKMAKDSKYASLTPAYRQIIQSINAVEHTRTRYTHSDFLTKLAQLVALHDGKASSEVLVRWAKFHNSAQVRTGAYLGLIQIGMENEVEQILKSEENRSVRQVVKDALI